MSLCLTRLVTSVHVLLGYAAASGVRGSFLPVPPAKRSRTVTPEPNPPVWPADGSVTVLENDKDFKSSQLPPVFKANSTKQQALDEIFSDGGKYQSIDYNKLFLEQGREFVRNGTTELPAGDGLAGAGRLHG